MTTVCLASSVLISVLLREVMDMAYNYWSYDTYPLPVNKLITKAIMNRLDGQIAKLSDYETEITTITQKPVSSDGIVKYVKTALGEITDEVAV